MKICVLRERKEFERRVAATPDSVRRLKTLGAEVVVESGAGDSALYHDDEFAAAGARVARDLTEALEGAQVLFCVNLPEEEVLHRLPAGLTVVGMLNPWANSERLAALAELKATLFSLELLPRISRAQAMDVLSSQATVSGYVAAVRAAVELPRFFPMFMTAAGTVAPAKVFVVGAGVAGLQAIATARRLGASVKAYDVRAAAAEEVASLGATFVDLGLESQEGAGGYAREQSEEFIRRQQQAMSDHVASSDVVITTAAIPGRPAPRIVSEDMIRRMAPGSVVYDLAAETGGNCELSRPGEVVVVGEVKVIGARNAPSQLPYHASLLYSRNLVEFLKLVAKDGDLDLDTEDEILTSTCLMRRGEPTSNLKA